MLALTCSHGLCDSAHLVKVTDVLAKACRGESVASVRQGLSREAMLPANLALSMPNIALHLDRATELLLAVLQFFMKQLRKSVHSVQLKSFGVAQICDVNDVPNLYIPRQFYLQYCLCST